MTQQSNGLPPQSNQPQASAPISQTATANSGSNDSASAPKKKPRRALYRAGRVAVSSVARESAGPDE